jgi:glycosyltransferase involved in cell wall biosynthesis
MRLLFFAGGSFVYGQEIVLLDLMARLKQEGHDVLAVVSGWNDGDYPGRLAAAGIPFVTLKLGRLYMSNLRWTMDGLRHMPRAAFQLLRLVATFAPDAIIHGDESLFQVAGRIVRSRKHYFYAHNLPNRRWYRPDGSSFVQRRIERFIACSEFARRAFVDAGVKSGRTRSVHNSVDLSVAVPPPAPEQTAPIALGIIGQLLPRKRHKLLFDALGELPPSMQAKVKVAVFGNADTPYGHDLKRHLVDTRLATNVEWRGFEKDRAVIYGAIDVAVCPFVNEPFGLVAAEAGAFGRPVIAAASGGLAEIVVHERTGLLVPPDDPRSLAAAIDRIVCDGKVRLSMGAEARKHIEDVFSIERQAADFIAALR